MPINFCEWYVLIFNFIIFAVACVLALYQVVLLVRSLMYWPEEITVEMHIRDIAWIAFWNFFVLSYIFWNIILVLSVINSQVSWDNMILYGNFQLAMFSVVGIFLILACALGRIIQSARKNRRFQMS